MKSNCIKALCSSRDGWFFFLLPQKWHHSLFDPLCEVTSFDHTFKHLYSTPPHIILSRKGVAVWRVGLPFPHGGPSERVEGRSRKRMVNIRTLTGEKADGGSGVVKNRSKFSSCLPGVTAAKIPNTEFLPLSSWWFSTEVLNLLSHIYLIIFHMLNTLALLVRTLLDCDTHQLLWRWGTILSSAFTNPPSSPLRCVVDTAASLPAPF